MNYREGWGYIDIGIWDVMVAIGVIAVGVIGMVLLVTAWCWWMEPRRHMEVSRNNFQGIWSRISSLEREVNKIQEGRKHDK